MSSSFGASQPTVDHTNPIIAEFMRSYNADRRAQSAQGFNSGSTQQSQPTESGWSLFGSGSTTQAPAPPNEGARATSGLLGGPQPPGDVRPAPGLFGSSGLFGSTQQAQPPEGVRPAPGLFGSTQRVEGGRPSTGLFGAPQAAGLFGAPQPTENARPTPGLFGSTQHAQSTDNDPQRAGFLFGQRPPPTNPLFGSSVRAEQTRPIADEGYQPPSREHANIVLTEHVDEKYRETGHDDQNVLLISADGVKFYVKSQPFAAALYSPPKQEYDGDDDEISTIVFRDNKLETAVVVRMLLEILDHTWDPVVLPNFDDFERFNMFLTFSAKWKCYLAREVMVAYLSRLPSQSADLARLITRPFILGAYHDEIDICTAALDELSHGFALTIPADGPEVINCGAVAGYPCLHPMGMGQQLFGRIPPKYMFALTRCFERFDNHRIPSRDQRKEMVKVFSEAIENWNEREEKMQY